MNIIVLQILNEGRIRNSLAYQFLPRQLCKHQKNTNHRHQHCHCHHHCQHHHHPHRQHHHVDDDHHHRQHYHHIKFQGGKWHGPVCGEDLSLFPGWYPICIAWSHLIQYKIFNDPYYHHCHLQWAILSSFLNKYHDESYFRTNTTWLLVALPLTRPRVEVLINMITIAMMQTTTTIATTRTTTTKLLIIFRWGWATTWFGKQIIWTINNNNNNNDKKQQKQTKINTDILNWLGHNKVW